MKKILLAAALIFFLPALAICQTDNDAISGAISRLKALLTDHVEEKAYLQFDRPYLCYVTGEAVYFKAYVTMGERHEPSTISNILHVDLIDKNDVILQSIALLLNKGTCWGDFALADTLQKGTYRIRAYTEWMRNDKHPYFFDQYISVGSITSADRVAENTTQGLKPDLQFFPEGGNIVADVPSKVAFKAIGTNGFGVNVKGVVIDNEHKEVAQINSEHLGMGVFSFIPEAGKTYTAKVTFGNGSQSTVDLPAVEAKGITLSVNNTDDPAKVSITIRTNHDYYTANKDKPLNLLLYYSGALKRYAPKLDAEVLGLDLPANTFPTGVLKVSLLSETGEPLCERLAFIQNPDQLNLAITAGSQVFTPRGNVSLNLNAKDKDGMPVSGSFSVSVIDESKIFVDENSEHTIMSDLLLTSELKGYIEKPNYYFAHPDKTTSAALDALMLTQGYRRFTWKELMNGSLPAQAITYHPEQGVDISGTLKTKSGEPIKGSAITLLAEQGGPILSQTTDEQGKFRFENVVFETGTRFILKATSSLAKKGVLTFDSATPEPEVSADNPLSSGYNADADILASFQGSQNSGITTASNGSTGVLLKSDNDNSVKTGSNKSNYRSSNLGGPGHADQVVLNDQFKNAPQLSAGLNGVLRGVQFVNGKPQLNTSSVVTGNGPQVEPMLVIVDGTDMGTGFDIDVINPVDVEAVEVLSGANASIYGVEGGQGVMVITSKQGNPDETVISKEMSPGIFSIAPKGFYKAREFYSPVYNAQNVANHVADQRTTVFWKPDVNTDTGGNASFNFFNSDSKGTYRVEVQGMDNQGKLGMQVFTYKVQ